MNDLEKLYKTIGLSNTWVEEYDGIQIWHKSYNEMIKSMMSTNDWSKTVATNIAKKECRKAYQPITAETQVKLEEYLTKYCCISFKYYYLDNNFYASVLLYNTINPKVSKAPSTTEALIKVLNELWQDLKEEHQNQIKTILWTQE